MGHVRESVVRKRSVDRSDGRVSLTVAGRQEAESRAAIVAQDDEPMEIGRDELAEELQRRFGWTEQQVAMNPELRADRFRYWPSIGAWTALPDSL